MVAHLDGVYKFAREKIIRISERTKIRSITREAEHHRRKECYQILVVLDEVLKMAARKAKSKQENTLCYGQKINCALIAFKRRQSGKLNILYQSDSTISCNKPCVA